MSVWVYAAIALVGGLGAIGRFLVDGAVSARAALDFPLGTLVVNLSGALLLGFCVGASLRGDGLAVVGTGVLGSYTTFSTWMLETQRLAEDGQTGSAALNVAGSLVLGIAAAAFGRALGELV